MSWAVFWCLVIGSYLPADGAAGFLETPVVLPVWSAGRAVTRLKIGVLLNDTASVTCVALPNGVNPPASSVQLIGRSLEGGTRSCVGHRKCSITIAGLQGNTPYDVYCAAEDADGLSDISEPVDGTTAMQVTPAWIRLPALYGSPTAHSIAIELTINKNTPAVCAALPAGAAVLTTTAAVQHSPLKGFRQCAAFVLCDIGIGGLVAETTYDVYCAVGDGVRMVSPIYPLWGIDTAPAGSVSFTIPPTIYGDPGMASFVLLLAVDFSALVSCAILATGATAPTLYAQVVGADTVLSDYCAVGDQCFLIQKNLLPNTAYDIYCMAKTLRGVLSPVSLKVAVQTKPVATVNFVVEPRLVLATTTALVVEAQPDSDASVLCAALPSGVTAPTRYSDLSSASDTVQETCDVAILCALRVSSMTPDMAYEIYCIASPIGPGLVSAVSPRLDASTLPEVVGTFVVAPRASGTPSPTSISIESMTNTEGTVTCAIVADRAEAPTTANNVLEARIKGSSQCIASQLCVVAIANAFLESAYDAYCILQPEAGIMSAVSARLDLQIPESDSAATFTWGPLIHQTTATTIRIKAKTFLWSDMTCAALPQYSARPSFLGISTAANRHTHTCLPGRMCWGALANLQPNTAYDIYCYLQLRDGATSAVSQPLTVTTALPVFENIWAPPDPN